MELILQLLYLAFITNTVVGVLMISRGHQKMLTLLFGLLSLCVAAWSVAIIGFYSSILQQFKVVEWVFLTHIAAFLIASMFVVFTNYFPRKILSWHFILIPLLIISLLAFYLLLISQSVVLPGEFGTYSIERYYWIYQILLLTLFFAGYIFLLYQYRRAKDTIRTQLLIIFFGSLISSATALITNLILPYIGIFKFTFLGPLFTLALVFSIFYAIAKYQLFDIKVIVTEIFSIVLIAILAIDLFSVSGFEQLVMKAIVLFGVILFSYLLIKGVYKEVHAREEIERLAQNLEQSNKDLEAANELKAKFLSIASHQFRSPLTAIKGYASLLLDGSYGDLPKEAEEPVERVVTASNNLALVVDDFLNLSRIEQGRMEYKFVDTDLREFLQSVVDEQEAIVQKKDNLSLKFYVIGNGPFNASIDRGKLKQVATNLVDNSIKYTPAGSIEVYLERDNDNQVFRFWTKDTGVGIAPETLPKLFGQFSRASNADQVNVMGTGLGLYIAREIVKAHGGKVWAESDGEGKGSKFIVELPIKRS